MEAHHGDVNNLICWSCSDDMDERNIDEKVSVAHLSVAG